MRIRDLVSFSRGQSSSDIQLKNNGSENGAANVAQLSKSVASEAVVFNRSIQATPAADHDPERDAKVKKIAERVQNGTYENDRQAVSVALIRDLGL